MHGAKVIGIFVKTPNSQYFSRKEKKMRACSGHKIIMFCITVIFIDRLHKIKHDKLKISNFYLVTVMLPSPKERLELSTLNLLNRSKPENEGRKLSLLQIANREQGITNS